MSTTKMKQKTKRELKPNLRFPEFRDASAWSRTSLEDALSPVVREREKPITPYTGLGIRSHGKGTFLKNLELPEKNSMEYLYEVQSDDLIVNITFAWEGAIAIAKQTDAGTLVSHRFPTYTFNKNVAIPEFFQYVILDKLFIYNLGVISPGGAGRNRVLNKNDFLKLTVFLPGKDEQKKIADCLSSLDELIAAQSQKLDALKDYKQGLLQQLFPAEGETIPRLRFPEFQNAGEWERKPLGECLLGSPDYGVNAPAVPYSPSLPAYLRITDISEDGYYLNDKRVSVDIDAVDENYLAEGDIALARTGASVGKSYKYRKEDGKLVFAGYLIRIKPNQKKIDSAFLFNFFSAKQYWNWVGVTSARSGQPGINGSEYATLPVPIPPTANEGELSEQQKIADCLSLLDELIAAQSQKLDALKTHKKGLLQQLFPAMDEVQE